MSVYKIKSVFAIECRGYPREIEISLYLDEDKPAIKHANLSSSLTACCINSISFGNCKYGLTCSNVFAGQPGDLVSQPWHGLGGMDVP